MTVRRGTGLAGALALVLLAGPTAAQSGATGATAAEATALPRVRASLCLDMVAARPGCETAILLASETTPDSADLVVIGQPALEQPQEILAIQRDIAYHGPFPGQFATLSEGPDGTLLLGEEQSAYGRTPWFQTITIRHDADGAGSGGDGFVVEAQAYATYDRPNGGSFSCDADFITGTWIAQADRVNPESGDQTSSISQHGRIEAGPVPLAEWSPARGLVPPCVAALHAWFDGAP